MIVFFLFPETPRRLVVAEMRRDTLKESYAVVLPQGNVQGNRPWNVLDMDEKAKQK